MESWSRDILKCMRCTPPREYRSFEDLCVFDRVHSNSTLGTEEGRHVDWSVDNLSARVNGRKVPTKVTDKLYE